jgi:hypothetical protein
MIQSGSEALPEKKTAVIMVSVGDRNHLTKYSFPRALHWANKHGYSCFLVTKNNVSPDRSLHFNKLIAHKELPLFDRYIIVDDDILISSKAPAVPEIDEGFIGLAKDAEQQNTEAPHVKWTANSGFIIANKADLYLLEEAYIHGEYPFKCGDRSGKGIWGPFDQGIINHILFEKKSIFNLDWRWNFQPVLDFFIHRGGGWEKWTNSRLTRIYYYVSLLVPFSTNRKLVKEAYCVHLIRTTHTAFFNKIVD